MLSVMVLVLQLLMVFLMGSKSVASTAAGVAGYITNTGR